MSPLPIMRVVALGVVTLAAVAAAGAQQPAGPRPGSKCLIEFLGSVGGRTTRTNSTRLPSGKFNVYVGGGFVGDCQGQNVTLQSDSAEYYGDQALMYLIGHVHYAEPRAKVDADHMTYWMDEERLQAEGNVYAVLASGTTMRGPIADYYRAVAPIRTQAMLVATGRPRLNLVQLDSITQKPSDTVNVVADRITSIADSLVYAGGDVRVTRPELFATGDSAFVDQGTGLARLMRKPTIEARRSRPFTLTGGVIDVFSQNRQVNRVVATPQGHATSQDLQLYADSVDLRVRANELERAMAWGKSRAHAVAPDRDIIADSIDALLPHQRIHEIHAVGNAYATSIPDTTTVRTLERDWMQGDTLIAVFDSLPPGDTSHTPPIRTLIAHNRARAYYHIKPSATNRAGSTNTRPGVNYVTGRAIQITFAQGAVDSVTVVGKASGVYIEAADTTAPPRTTPRTTPQSRPVAPPQRIRRGAP